MNLERFAQAAAAPRTKDVPVPELAGWGLFDEGEPLVWTVRSLSALEFYRAAEAQNDAVRTLHTALAKALAGADGAVNALRDAAEQTPGEFSKKLDLLALASVSPAVGMAQRDVVVRLSEVLPSVFWRLVNEVELLFVQGAELGKSKPSGVTGG
jgi:hypothetical protein